MEQPSEACQLPGCPEASGLKCNVASPCLGHDIPRTRPECAYSYTCHHVISTQHCACNPGDIKTLQGWSIKVGRWYMRATLLSERALQGVPEQERRRLMASADAMAVVAARSSTWGFKKGHKASVATATAASSGGSATAVSHATNDGLANSTAVATGEHSASSRGCMHCCAKSMSSGT